MIGCEESLGCLHHCSYLIFVDLREDIEQHQERLRLSVQMLVTGKTFSLAVIQLTFYWNESFLRFHYTVLKDSTKMHEEDHSQKYTVLSEYGDAY